MGSTIAYTAPDNKQSDDALTKSTHIQNQAIDTTQTEDKKQTLLMSQHIPTKSH